MKKIFSLIIAVAMFAGNAQAFEYEPEEGLTWMGLFGMNVSKLQNHTYGAKAGAMMGLRTDYMLPYAHGAYVTAGLDWTMKGGKKSVDAIVGGALCSATGKYNLHYFELPIRVGFRYNLSEEFGLYGEFGPYFAVGVGGKHKLSVDMDGDAANLVEDAGTYKAFKDYGYPTETFQRWDAGLGFRIGAEYNKHYNLLIGCDWGLCDIYRDSLRDAYFDNLGLTLSKVRNFNFSIAVGYRF